MSDTCWCVVRGSQVRVCFAERTNAEGYIDMMAREERSFFQVVRVEYVGPSPLVRDVAAIAQAAWDAAARAGGEPAR